MVKPFLLICIFATWVVVANCEHHHDLNAPPNPPSPSPSPSPIASADCSSIIYDMADCITFISNGSTETTPESSCCSGLKTVLSADAECVCVAINSSAELGIELNITKAMSLPSACGLSAPPLNNCGTGISVPGVAPANPPDSTRSGPSPKSPAPTHPPKRSPAGHHSGTYSVSSSWAVAMLVASFSYILV